MATPPAIFLEEGKYSITGDFPWKQLSESLLLPKNVGIASLEIDGQEVAFPAVDAEGNVWLRKKEDDKQATNADQLDVKVFRRLTDGIPFEVTTRVVLNISGQNREISLSGALLPGFTVKEVTGALPVRLEENGVLRVKARPGTWNVDVTGYSAAPVNNLTLPTPAKNWPDNEIWVFDSQADLRAVDVVGVYSIDPRQTDLPQEWQALPAYLMKPEAAMALEEKQRGDSGKQPDRLSLSRQLWLDFDGRGYTAKDTITGEIHQSSRVTAKEGTTLGRVSVNGKEQFITALEGDKRPGVEVQQGYLNLSADSRVEDAKGTLNAVGWAHDFNEVSAVLSLPPGWKLFAASGVDRVSHSWISDWTLFDIFLVLFATIAMVKLMGIKPGILALVALVFVHTELKGLGWLALFILAMIALMRVLPQSWFRTAVSVLMRGAQVMLVLVVVPFMLYHMRDAIHPQLRGFYYGSNVMQDYRQQGGMAETMQMNVPVSPSLELPPLPSVASPVGGVAKRAFNKVQSFEGFYQYDPSITVQTGFGVANWQAERIQLTWNGPVDQGQDMDLWLMSPMLNLFLACVRVILLLALMALLFEVKVDKFKNCIGHLPRRKASLACLLFFLMGAVMPHQAKAEEPSYPPAELLSELKNYVAKELDTPPECLPQCAEIPNVRLQVEGSVITMYLQIDTVEDVAVPLPGTARSWHIRHITVDGKEGGLQLAANDGYVWIFLEKGVHDVVVAGNLPERGTASVNFALTPRYATYDVSGWELHGVNDKGVVEQSLQLVRTQNVEAKGEEGFDATQIPPFARVDRHIYLGTSWTVETSVMRLTPPGATAVMRIPLLEGESVLTKDWQVKDGHITVQMGPADKVVQWSSILKTSPKLTLEAEKEVPWVEMWQLHTTNLWHVEAKGFPEILNNSNVPSWRPWPGEKLVVDVTKPKGVEGQTKTIDNAKLSIALGQRAQDATLAFTIRSSKGDQHVIKIPEGAVLQSLSINGRQQPLQQNGQEVILPLSPGSQVVNLSWKQPKGVKAMFKTSAVDMGLPLVNIEMSMTLPQNRWVLFTGGSLVGPAVLFWGIFPVIVALAIALGMVRITPLKHYHWLLLLLGLSQTTIAANFIVAGWLLMVGLRQRNIMEASAPSLFNARQMILGLWAVAAVLSIFVAIKHGLLGTPDMKIMGNGSSAYNLQWYQDIAGNMLPRAWVFSLPVLVYRLLMLAWALWLAFAFTSWLKWGWKCFSEGGIWRKDVLEEAVSVPQPGTPGGVG